MNLSPKWDKVAMFQAPYLIERLIDKGICNTAVEAEVLFLELKRYLFLVGPKRAKNFGMYSAFVDEAWHQFILYTREYERFCRECFGNYIAHLPNNAPSEGLDLVETSTFVQFEEAYQRTYQRPLPAIWQDHMLVRGDTALRRTSAIRLRRDGEEVVIISMDRALARISKLALDSLKFISQTRIFFPRELPAPLTLEEKTGLSSELVRVRLLDLHF